MYIPSAFKNKSSSRGILEILFCIFVYIVNLYCMACCDSIITPMHACLYAGEDELLLAIKGVNIMNMSILYVPDEGGIQANWHR